MTSRNWAGRPRKSLANSWFLNLTYVCAAQWIQAFINLNTNICSMHTNNSIWHICWIVTHRAAWWWFNPNLCADPGSNRLISWIGWGILLLLWYFSHDSFWRTEITATQYVPKLWGSESGGTLCSPAPTNYRNYHTKQHWQFQTEERIYFQPAAVRWHLKAMFEWSVFRKERQCLGMIIRKILSWNSHNLRGYGKWGRKGFLFFSSMQELLCNFSWQRP